jgi:hypothetical protein
MYEKHLYGARVQGIFVLRDPRGHSALQPLVSTNPSSAILRGIIAFATTLSAIRSTYSSSL